MILLPAQNCSADSLAPAVSRNCLFPHVPKIFRQQYDAAVLFVHVTCENVNGNGVIIDPSWTSNDKSIKQFIDIL